MSNDLVEIIVDQHPGWLRFIGSRRAGPSSRRTVILPRLFHPHFPSDSYLVASLFTDNTRRRVFSPRLFTFSTPVIFLLFLPRSGFLFSGAFSVHHTAPSTHESSSSFSCLGPHCGFQKIATETAQFLVLTAA